MDNGCDQMSTSVCVTHGCIWVCAFVFDPSFPQKNDFKKNLIFHFGKRLHLSWALMKTHTSLEKLVSVINSAA